MFQHITSHSALLLISAKWNSNISVHLSSVISSHHFTFLWGPLFMLPSNWLSSDHYGTMYCVIIQCNTCTFCSLFVWSMILYIISHFSEFLFLCCLPTDWALVLMVQVYSIMHVHFTVCLFDQWYCYIGNNFTKKITSYLKILCLLLPNI